MQMSTLKEHLAATTFKLEQAPAASAKQVSFPGNFLDYIQYCVIDSTLFIYADMLRTQLCSEAEQRALHAADSRRLVLLEQENLAHVGSQHQNHSVFCDTREVILVH